jgi:hypothetical protein
LVLFLNIVKINVVEFLCYFYRNGKVHLIPPFSNRNDIKYNNKKIDTLKIKQMLKIELKSNTAVITKSLLLNNNIGKLLFENLQTKLT